MPIRAGLHDIDSGLAASDPTAALLLDTYPTAMMAYSFRKLRAAYAGSAVRIRRSSDNAEANIGFVGEDFDSAVAATHIGGGSGYIVTWYDQSGNGIDVTQVTAANQPLYVASGQNSRPVADFDGVSDFLTKTSVGYAAMPAVTATVMAVMNDDNSTDTNTTFAWDDGAGRLGTHASYSNVIYWDFSNTGTGRVSVAEPSGWNTGGHLLELGRDTSDDQYIVVDGTELLRVGPKTAVLTSGTGGFTIGGLSASVYLGGFMAELVIWAADLAGNRTAARANVKDYWGTP